MDFDSPFLVFLPHTLRDAPWSSYIFPTSVLESGIFLMEPWFLALETCVRNKGLGARSAYCNWGIIASRSSQLTEQRTMCLCILSHLCDYICGVYIYICKYIYMYMHIYLCYEKLKHRNEKIEKTNMVTEGERAGAEGR